MEINTNSTSKESRGERSNAGLLAPREQERKAMDDSLEQKIPFGRSLRIEQKVWVSKHLSATQVKGALKAGDVIIPGDGRNLPSFSETGFISEIDRMLDHMTEDDRSGVLMLFALFRFLPAFAIRLTMEVSRHNKHFPDLIGAPLRLIYIGIRGIFFTLYYSNLDDSKKFGRKIFDEMKYQTKCGEEKDVTTTNSYSWENPNVETVAEIYTHAKQAKKEIERLGIKERLRCISALKSVILEKKEEIIDCIQRESRKSRSDALFSEIFGILDHLTFLENEAQKVLADQKIKTPLALMGKKSLVQYSPLGTVLIISPWNYPFYQAIVPITTSFVAGNATIYKPSEFTPLKGLVEEVLKASGFSPDWIQVVYGDGKTGALLIDHGPDKIFFTGSVETGKKIMGAAATQIIPVELELGGKDPMIVFEDANLDRAVAGAAWGAFTNTGQSCTSVERLYVQSGVYEEFKNRLVKAARKIKQEVDETGPSRGDADIGWMTTNAQVNVVRKHWEEALANGAVELTGHDWDGTSAKIPPMILEQVAPDMLVVKEETFGPLVALIPFEDEGEAIEMANDSIYGLSASVWTKDKERADRVTRALQTGNVSVNNVMLTEGNHHLPFGGTKKSGIGRYKGAFGLHSFSNLKSVLIDANSSKIEANWYPYTKKKYALFSSLTEGLFSGGLRGLAKFAISGLKVESYSGKAAKSESRD